MDGSNLVWVKEAQPGDSEIWYVWQGEPALLQKAGYVSFGPFAFGGHGPNEATTTEIEKSLPDATSNV